MQEGRSAQGTQYLDAKAADTRDTHCGPTGTRQVEQRRPTETWLCPGCTSESPRFSEPPNTQPAPLTDCTGTSFKNVFKTIVVKYTEHKT